MAPHFEIPTIEDILWGYYRDRVDLPQNVQNLDSSREWIANQMMRSDRTSGLSPRLNAALWLVGGYEGVMGLSDWVGQWWTCTDKQHNSNMNMKGPKPLACGAPVLDLCRFCTKVSLYTSGNNTKVH